MLNTLHNLNSTLSSSDSHKPPGLPRILSTPLKLFPDTVHSKIMAGFLNKALIQHINDGDLDFLNDRHICLNIIDTHARYHISLSNDKIIAITPRHACDLFIQAHLYDFLSLAARKEDPDTLVFQRRLIMQGDTELGLELKNFLDGVDLSSDIKLNYIKTLVDKSLPVYKKLFR